MVPRTYRGGIEELQIRRLLRRYEYSKRREQLVRAIVWRLPHDLVYWSVIRVWAHGTRGRWGNTHPDELNWNQALQRWNEFGGDG